MSRLCLSSLCFLGITLLPAAALAVKSAEFYTSASYGYGRVEARMRFAAGDGVVSSFFLWKDGSELAGTFWNELDIEKLGADCHIETNALYGNPAAVHAQSHALAADLCGTYHTYAYEWTPDYIAWFVDGVEVRRETGDTATAFAENASGGMQIRFNLWPGDVTFGGNFSPEILPVHEYLDWVEFSSYQDGAFTLQWREDFDAGSVPAGWAAATWNSPKNLSTHDPGNVSFIDGFAVLSLTADDAVGPAGANPEETGSAGSAGAGSGGAAGSGSGGTPVAGAGGSAGSSPGAGAGAGSAGIAGSDSGGTPGATAGAGSAASPASAESGGCSCSLRPVRSTNAVLGALGLAAMGVLARRRNRKPCTSGG